MLLDFVLFFLAIISSLLDNNRWLTIGLFEISTQQTNTIFAYCVGFNVLTQGLGASSGVPLRKLSCSQPLDTRTLVKSEGTVPETAA